MNSGIDAPADLERETLDMTAVCVPEVEGKGLQLLCTVDFTSEQ